MDVSEKKTVLDDSASIYQRREEKSERAKWKDLKGFKAKWEHFRAYYLSKTLIWACVIAFVVYAVYAMLKPEKEKMLYVTFLDAAVLTEELERLEAGYGEYIGLDSETQTTTFDNTVMISSSGDAASAQKFTAHAYVGDIDVIVATESVVKSYAETYLLTLDKQLPADMYESLSERFCYATPIDEDGNPGEEAPYGIYISDLIEESPYLKEPVVLAICGNTSRAENAVKFVRYLLGQAPETVE